MFKPLKLFKYLQHFYKRNTVPSWPVCRNSNGRVQVGTVLDT